eukprot:6489324-Amphidinium_carterae.2
MQLLPANAVKTMNLVTVLMIMRSASANAGCSSCLAANTMKHSATCARNFFRKHATNVRTCRTVAVVKQLDCSSRQTVGL